MFGMIVGFIVHCIMDDAYAKSIGFTSAEGLGYPFQASEELS